MAKRNWLLNFGWVLGSWALAACETSSHQPMATSVRDAAATQTSRPPSGQDRSEERLSEAPTDESRALDTPTAAQTKQASHAHPTGALALDALPPVERSPHFVRDGVLTVPWLEDADASGVDGTVTSVEAHATDAGVEILKAGGNAVDAAVATAFALAVTHPSAGNIGGGGFMLLKQGDQVEAIDFRENSPSGLRKEAFWAMIAEGGRGPAAVGVPGTVAGLHLAHERHGRLSWERLLVPAVRLAREGFSLGLRQAQTLLWAQSEFSRDPLARRLFYSRTPHIGIRIEQPELASTLQAIADHGPSAFYSGKVADDLVESLGERGILTREDLKNYRAELRRPLSFDFYGFRVVTTPSPSAGGVALTQNLLMLAKLDVATTAPESAERYHLWAEVSRRSQIERQLFVVAPESLSAEQREAARARALSADTWLGAHPVDLRRASDSRALDSRYGLAEAELPHTTHFSVTDADGGLVSCTVTLSGSFGARIMTHKTGIVLNNSVASFSSMGLNTPGPGRRTTSSMAPTLAFLGPEHALVLGSPGGNTIPNTITQVFTRLALDGLSLQAAVALPRVHQGFAPQHLELERTHPLREGVLGQLERMGHGPRFARYAMGDANVAAWVRGRSAAVYDRREGGAARAADDVRANGSDSNTDSALP